MARDELQRKRFKSFAKALYGDNYYRQAAEQFKVNKKTVEKWASGHSRVPRQVWFDLEKLLKEESQRLYKLASEANIAGQTSDWIDR